MNIEDGIAKKLWEQVKSGMAPNDRDYYTMTNGLINECRLLRSNIFTADDLAKAWAIYVKLFEEEPHGTIKQIEALLQLVPPSVTKWVK